MLDQEGVEYAYREYRQQPLAAEEIRDVLAKLGLKASQVLRRRDPVFKQLALTGDEGEEALISHMAGHPTLLARPIGVSEDRAVVGRPVERLLELV